MAKISFDGMDELRRALEQLEKKAEKMSEKTEVSFSELFTETFMLEYTDFSSIDDLLKAGGFRADNDEEFDAIPEKELDSHISKVTRFSTFRAMLEEAVAQYRLRQLDF